MNCGRFEPPGDCPDIVHDTIQGLWHLFSSPKQAPGLQQSLAAQEQAYPWPSPQSLTTLKSCLWPMASLQVSDTLSLEASACRYSCSMCLLAGGFASCIMLPGVTYPAHFFKKHRMLVLSLISLSQPVVYLVLPPVATFLIKSSSWREANLVMSAICMQVITRVFICTQGWTN